MGWFQDVTGAPIWCGVGGVHVVASLLGPREDLFSYFQLLSALFLHMGGPGFSSLSLIFGKMLLLSTLCSVPVFGNEVASKLRRVLVFK